MEIVITIITIVLMLFLLIKEIYDPLKVFLLAVTIFLISGIVSIDEAVGGFSNKGVLTVAVLFVLAGCVEKSSYFQELTKFNNLKKDNFKPYKLFGVVMGLSAFLNNTPIVSLFIPITNKISDKTGVSASKLLIPISYLSILGGMLTLIGTSTNLVISGLIEEMGLEPLGFFELTKVSIVPVILGFIYIYLAHDKRLPDNSHLLEQSISQTNEHFVRFIVKEGSSIIGKTIKGANLRALTGVYLVEIERNSSRIFPITPDEIIEENDVLVFAGQTSQIDELRSIDKLVLETDYDIDSNYFSHDSTVMLEVVMTQYIGKPSLSIKELNFREIYNAVVIGIIRNGECINKKIGAITPKLGDIFLLIADKGSTGFIEQDRAFTIINKENRTIVQQHKNNLSPLMRLLGSAFKSIFFAFDIENSMRGFYPFIAFIGTVLLTLIFGFDILFSATLGLAFLLLTNTVQIKDALNMVEYKTIILISMSFAIGKAITNSGTAEFIAKTLEPAIVVMNPMAIMLIIFAITTIFTTVITNNAAAVIVVPIVFEIAKVAGVDARPFLMITAIAASSAFLSPYAYQTNTMVYGAGGYRFKDFIKFGYPLISIVAIVSIVMSYYIYF